MVGIPVTLFFYLFGACILIGGIIAAINHDKVNETTERIEAWARKNKARAYSKSGWYNKLVSRPFFWLLVKFSDWTDTMAHRGLKNGIRAASALSLLAITTALVIYGGIIVLSLVIVWFILKFSLAMIADNESSKDRYNRSERVLGVTGKDQRINPETGEIEKESLFGWTKTGKRIDPDTGDLEEDSIFGYTKTGTRVNQQSGRVQDDGLFGHTDTNIRVNPETGVIEEETLLGWQSTGERIDPESGRRQKYTYLGWVDV